MFSRNLPSDPDGGDAVLDRLLSLSLESFKRSLDFSRGLSLLQRKQFLTNNNLLQTDDDKLCT